MNESTYKKKALILSKVGSSIGVPDEHMTGNFLSAVSRDVLEGLPKDIKLNPGPGTYDT